MNFRRNLLVVGLFALALGMRFLPYLLMQFRDEQTTPGLSFFPWNFSPVMTICLFSGAVFSERRLSYGLPMAIAVISDLGIGLLMQNMSFAFHTLVPFTYLAWLLATWMGHTFLRRREAWKIAVGGFVSELAFFLLTNAANWQLMPTHPGTLEGLALTYVDGLPFFVRSLVGTMMFSVLLFGGYALAEHFATRREASPQTV
ncbi:MAG: DUF6580 family putative transport protein [Planctomycetales bacterium]